MKAISQSATVTINALAMQKKGNGERVYNFAAGDPFLNNHWCITHAAVRETQKQYCPYPPVEGIPELRILASEWLNASCRTQYSKDNVLVTCGGKFALFSIIYSLLQAGEEVLIPAPFWVSYPDIVKMAGGRPKMVPASHESGWKINAEDLRKHASEKSKILIFNNACNPTGALYSREEVALLLNAAKEAGLIVVSDEVYSGLVYDGLEFVSCGSFPEHAERVIIVQSCSKNFGMTGWRIGFVFAPHSVVRRLAVLQGQSTTGTALMSQWAAMGALENAAEVNAYIKNAMCKRRDMFADTFNSLFPVKIEKPQSALYAFVPISSMQPFASTDADAFCERAMVDGNVALVPGKAFGVDGYARFAFSGPEEELVAGLQILKKMIGDKSP